MQQYYASQEGLAMRLAQELGDAQAGRISAADFKRQIPPPRKNEVFTDYAKRIGVDATDSIMGYAPPSVPYNAFSKTLPTMQHGDAPSSVPYNAFSKTLPTMQHGDAPPSVPYNAFSKTLPDNAPYNAPIEAMPASVPYNSVSVKVPTRKQPKQPTVKAKGELVKTMPDYRSNAQIRRSASTATLRSQLSAGDLAKVDALLKRKKVSPPNGLGEDLRRANGTRISLPDVYQDDKQMKALARQLKMPVADLRKAMGKYYNAK